MGAIASYQWSFGDGQSATTTIPTTTHVYALPGTYTVALTVTDTAGTSLAQVFTGQTMSLDGGPQATVTHTITISAPKLIPGSAVTPSEIAPALTHLTQSHSVWREGSALASFAKAAKHQRAPIGTTFSFSLNEPARVSLTFTRALSGRSVKGRCVAETKKNGRGHACTREAIDGRLAFTGHAGINKVSFQGSISRSSKLAPGRYTLAIAATAALTSSKPATLSFTIAAS